MPPTSAETSRLVESQPERARQCCWTFFVEEATEVAAAVAPTTLNCRPIMVVVTCWWISAAFHTLWWGRMVGQTDLAEVAWRVERY